MPHEVEFGRPLSRRRLNGVVAGCSGSGATMAPVAQRANVGLPNGALNLVYVADQLQKAVLAFPAGERAQNPPPVQTISFSGVYPEGVWVDRQANLYVALSAQGRSDDAVSNHHERY